MLTLAEPDLCGVAALNGGEDEDETSQRPAPCVCGGRAGCDGECERFLTLAARSPYRSARAPVRR